VLAYLDRDGTRASELADRAQLSRQAITQLVDELEELGVLERHPDPTDGRAKIVRYTPLALEHFDASRGVIADIERRWGDSLGESRYEDLRKMLSELLSSPGP
jgi:DNA-binding MarR family transcriptional regulator